MTKIEFSNGVLKIEISDDARIDELFKNQTIIMGQIENFNAAISRIDAVTTQIGGEVVRIAGKFTEMETALKNVGLTAEQEATLLRVIEGQASNAEAIAASLTLIGKDEVIPPADVPPADQPPAEPVTNG